MHVATPDAGFGRADLTTFCRLDELGLEVTGQRLEPDRAVLACRVVEPAGSDERWCRRGGGEGAARDSVTRRLAHEPLGWRPRTLPVTVRRYCCGGRGHVWRQDTSRAGEPRAELSGRGRRWALEGIVVQHLCVAGCYHHGWRVSLRGGAEFGRDTQGAATAHARPAGRGRHLGATPCSG